MHHRWDVALVESDDDVRDMATFYLAEFFNVTAYSDENSFLAAVTGGKVFHVVLLDVAPRSANEWNTFRLFRAKALTPVIAFSTGSLLEEITVAFDLGVADYLTKPYDL